MNLNKKDLAAIQSIVQTEIHTAIQTTEKNLSKKIDQLRADTSMALGDLAEKLDVYKEIDSLKQRVSKLENLQRLS